MDRVGFADRPRRFASSRPFRVSRPQTLYYPLPSHPHPELVTHSSRACGYPTSPSFPSFFFRLSQVTASWGAFLGDAAASGSSQPFFFFSAFSLSFGFSQSFGWRPRGPRALLVQPCWHWHAALRLSSWSFLGRHGESIWRSTVLSPACHWHRRYWHRTPTRQAVWSRFLLARPCTARLVGLDAASCSRRALSRLPPSWRRHQHQHQQHQQRTGSQRRHEPGPTPEG